MVRAVLIFRRTVIGCGLAVWTIPFDRGISRAKSSLVSMTLVHKSSPSGIAQQETGLQLGKIFAKSYLMVCVIC